MKSTQWPIHWTYSGDKDKAKEFHGEGRALIGMLKNNTYGGANLGQNKATKEYQDGVIIKAEILPGVDKVNIFVPEEEAGKEKEEIRYDPYLWVGSRITSGGTALYGTFPQIFSTDGCAIHMWVFEPPQKDKLGQNWSVYDPNETQLVTSERHYTSPIYFAHGTACMYPVQSHNYWKPFYGQDMTSFISYGKDIGQAFIKRCTKLVYAERRYYNGPGLFKEDLLYQLTDDGLMTADWMNPYDPQYDHANPDNDKIWYTTAWCDPYTQRYEWEDGMAPIMAAGGIFPSSGPGGGGIQGDDYQGNIEWQVYQYFHDPYNQASDYEYEDGRPIVRARVIPGNYVVKLSFVCGEHCAEWLDSNVTVDVEGRVGSTKFGGYQLKKRVTFSKTLSGGESIYALNHMMYGWWEYGHAATGPNFGNDGFGPCIHNPGSWWQGAMLIDALNGAITVVDYFDFRGLEGYQYYNTDTYWGGPCTDQPYGSGYLHSLPCNHMPCTEVPCMGIRENTALHIVGFPHQDNPRPHAYAHYRITGSYGPFTYGYVYADYLLGRYGYVECSWTLTDNFTIGVDGFLPDLFNHFTYICDEKHPNYNGERWHSYTYGMLEGYDFEPIALGDKVVVVLPDTGHLRVVKQGSIFEGFLRQAPADFDRYIDPPEGY